MITATSIFRRLSQTLFHNYLRGAMVTIDEFLRLRADLPVVDVRSQNEFGAGHIRGALNIPILNNEERAAVGTDYKLKGQAEAIKTGFRLAGPRFSDIIAEAEHISQGAELLVHCWRGGMRSSNFCQLLGMAKIKSFPLKGGYKAYREAALRSYETPMKLLLIGGYTGGGKSEVLRALRERGEQILDLEALACHKGSVFGGLMMPPQPTTEQFQNELFEEILALDTSRRIWVEDESLAIGQIFLPQTLWKQMNAAPVYQMEVDKAVRIERLVSEYGAADKEAFLTAMEKINRKLGGQNFKDAKQKLLEHEMAAVIEILLTYYDRAYETGLKNKQHRIKASVAWNGTDSGDLAARLIASAD